MHEFIKITIIDIANKIQILKTEFLKAELIKILDKT